MDAKDKRIQDLTNVIHHISCCVTCLTCLNNGWGESLCKNGEKLMQKAKVPPAPDKFPKGMGPCFKSGTKTVFWNGPIIDPKKVN